MLTCCWREIELEGLYYKPYDTHYVHALFVYRCHCCGQHYAIVSLDEPTWVKIIVDESTER